jgi:flagellar biosynthesis protein FliP
MYDWVAQSSILRICTGTVTSAPVDIFLSLCLFLSFFVSQSLFSPTAEATIYAYVLYDKNMGCLLIRRGTGLVATEEG